MTTTIKTFKRFPILNIFFAAILAGCATTPKFDENSSTKIDVSDTKNFKLKATSSKIASGVVEYQFKSSQFKSQWITCTKNPKDPFVVIFGSAPSATDATKFCNEWMAQAILQSGFNVVTVNRPGHGQSSGKDDFGGPQSVAGAVDAIKTAVGNNSIAGFWGFDTGTITAAFTAKSFTSIKWLLLGNGFYDLEVVERSTKSDTVRSAISNLKAADGDIALEQRSVAWDTSKLPNRIAIYHARDDEEAPKAQADAFNDQLRTIQTKVTFDDLEGVGHDLPWQAHFQIVMKILKALPK